MKPVFIFIWIAVELSSCIKDPFDRDLHQRVLDTELCNQQLKLLENSTDSMFHEANENIPRNLRFEDGNLHVGDFSKCLSIHEEHGTLYQGKYCLVSAVSPNQPTMPSYFDELMEYRGRRKWYKFRRDLNCRATNATSKATYTFSVCIPRACSIDRAMTPLLNLENRPITIDGEEVAQTSFSKIECRLPNDKLLTEVDYVAASIFGSIFLLAAVSTAYDILHLRQKEDGKKDCVYRSFSVYTNVRRLVSCSSPPDTLQCIDGIRVLCMVGVMVVHTYYIYTSTKPSQLAHKPYYLYACQYTVDTFFTISGLLVVYTTIPKYKTVKNFLRSLHMFYLDRLVRMYPTMCTVVLLQASLFNHIGDGPKWNDVISEVIGTQRGWWVILSFVLNVIFLCGRASMGLLWYTSVDMQFYVLSPLVLAWLFGCKRTAWAVLAIALLASQTCNTVLCFMLNAQSGVLVTYNFSLSVTSALIDYMEYYFNPLSHLTPFFIGMLTGYLIHVCKRKGTTVRISWKCTLTLLTLSFLSLVLLVFFDDLRFRKYNQVMENFSLSFSSSIWSICVCCIIFCCELGYGGVINRFLSSHMWKIFSTLSFTIYVLHYQVITLISSTQFGIQIIADNRLLDFSIIIFLSSTGGAALIYIFVDLPFANIYRVYVRKKN